MHDTTEGEEAGLWPKVKSFFFKLGSVEALGYARDVMMSPWLFDIYIKGAVREVNASKHVGKKKFESIEWWNFNLLLFSGYISLVADS